MVKVRLREKGYSHRFSRRRLIGNKALRQAKTGWQSPFFHRAHFCHGLLGPDRLGERRIGLPDHYR